MLNLTIENNATITEKMNINLAYGLACNKNNMNDFMDQLKAFSMFTVGRGGNHIWFANKYTNERIAIITNVPA